MREKDEKAGGAVVLEEIKKCPFCGNEASYLTTHRRHDFDDAIECDSDSCGVFMTAWVEGSGNLLKHQLIEKWNARADSSAMLNREIEIESLQRNLRLAKTALDSYADEENWRMVEVWHGEFQNRQFCCEGFGGTLAKATLKVLEKGELKLNGEIMTEEKGKWFGSLEIYDDSKIEMQKVCDGCGGVVYWDYLDEHFEHRAKEALEDGTKFCKFCGAKPVYSQLQRQKVLDSESTEQIVLGMAGGIVSERLDRIELERQLEAANLEIEAVKKALWNFHSALDNRKHGEVAAWDFIHEIEKIFDSHWNQGATLESETGNQELSSDQMHLQTINSLTDEEYGRGIFGDGEYERQKGETESE